MLRIYGPQTPWVEMGELWRRKNHRYTDWRRLVFRDRFMCRGIDCLAGIWGHWI
jgi:hypothetical protein